MIVESPNKIQKLKKILPLNWDIKASVGHIRTLSNDYKNNIGLDSLYNPIFQTLPGKTKIIKNITKNLSQYNRIYLATDPDREGEAIAYHLLQVIPKKYQNNIKRVSFNDLSSSTVLNSLKNPQDINYNIVKSQFFRNISDKLIGYRGTNLLKLYDNNIKSIGRVQAVGIQLLMERQKEIDNYRPKYRKTHKVKIKDDLGNIHHLTQVDSKLKHISYPIDIENTQGLPQSNSEGIITLKLKEIKTTNVLLPPPLPYNTSSALSTMSKKYNFTVKHVSNLLQKLFELGLITYIRTDSTYISPEFIDQSYLTIGPSLKNKIVKRSFQRADNREAHEAIRIVDFKITPKNKSITSLNPDLQKIYQDIYQRTYNIFLPDQENQNITYIFEPVDQSEEKEPHLYIKNETVVINKGWNQSFNEMNKPPQLSVKKNIVYPGSMFTEQYISNPKPVFYTESTLIKTLEKNKVGRPSTYVTYINTLKDKEYVFNDKGSSALRINDLGIRLYELSQKLLKPFSNINFTSEVFEKECDRIVADTPKDPDTYKTLIKKWDLMFDNLFQQYYNNKQSKNIKNHENDFAIG